MASLSEIISANRLLTEYDKACIEELKLGTVLATLSKDNKAGCKIRFHSLLSAAAIWSGEKGRIECGFAIIDTAPDNVQGDSWSPSLINLYTDEAITVLRRTNNRWTAERKEALIESVATALDTTSHSKECLSWIKSARILSIADTAEEHSSFYENLCKVCFIVIHAVMLSNANKFEALMQDFMADASQTLATQRRCENGWHKGLRPFTGTILADEYRKMEQNQANALAYANMLEKLDSAIG